MGQIVIRSAGTLTPANFASPTVPVSLVASDGVLNTALRSDAGLVIDQSIVPAWSGQHTFTNAAANGALVVATAAPAIGWTETDAAADNRIWRAFVNVNEWKLQTANDSLTAALNAIVITRSGNAVTALTLGNPTNNPTFNFDSTGLATFGGQIVQASAQLARTSVAYTNNAAAQAATLLNGPTAGNPTKWIPVNDNGTIRNIPAW